MTFTVFAQPVFDMIQAFLVLQMNFKPTELLHFVARFSYVDIISTELQICIILGVMMVLAHISALRGLILQAKEFQYYS
ncbi:hypothetical protein RHSIM_Rhsim03G0107400 [Rhododendron simsii]|uniref:Uncharacterized protein n=1 Tax=Rhododendron simsii TaxID=118357 RepID=A0A834LTK7_RHOSS|nr:hypothetical protein RHSIM_Rhsim03G0107400 [Rhododendron simsii]